MYRFLWYDYVYPLSPITTQEKPYVDEILFFETEGPTKKDYPIAPDNQ
jgi:hypothetical protein